MKKRRIALLGWMLLAAVLAACGGGPYEERFDETGSWGSGNSPEASGDVASGVYDFAVLADNGIYWATAGENFGDGVYQLEAKQIEGTLDNGYGMLFMVDNDTDSFYAFEVSGDGYYWIGRCTNACQDENQPLNGTGWVESAAVNQGRNVTNVLRVEVQKGNMVFFVNNQEVGRVSDNTFTEGDIGLLMETLGEGGVRVHFDNFTYTPLE